MPESSAFEVELAIEKLKSQSIKIDNISLERVVELKYLGTTITNRNSIQEEIKSSLKLECLPSFGAESFIFHVTIQKFKD